MLQINIYVIQYTLSSLNYFLCNDVVLNYLLVITYERTVIFILANDVLCCIILGHSIRYYYNSLFYILTIIN